MRVFVRKRGGVEEVECARRLPVRNNEVQGCVPSSSTTQPNFFYSDVSSSIPYEFLFSMQRATMQFGKSFTRMINGINLSF